MATRFDAVAWAEGLFSFGKSRSMPTANGGALGRVRGCLKTRLTESCFDGYPLGPSATPVGVRRSVCPEELRVRKGVGNMASADGVS